jgi:hypothetical protein
MKLNVKTDDIEFGTNILKISVPKKLRVKVKCGVDYIDSALGSLRSDLLHRHPGIR